MNIPLPGRPRTRDIDMVPMISFVFLLLIFFLLIGHYGAADPFAVRPPVSSLPTSSESTSTGLLLSANGHLAWGRERMAPAEAIRRAVQWSAAHPHQSVSIKADAAMEAVELIGLLERLKAAGVTRVLLLTTPAGMQS